jgi:hypothetical protein
VQVAYPAGFNPPGHAPGPLTVVDFRLRTVDGIVPRIRGVPMSRTRSVVAAAVVPLLVLFAAAVAALAAPRPAAAAAVTVPSECKFGSSDHTDVSRFEVCDSYPITWQGFDIDTGKVNGEMQGRFNEWFKLDGKSLTVERGVQIQAFTGAWGTMLTGVDIEITNPCLLDSDYNCTSDAPAQLLFYRDLVEGTSYAKTFHETYHLPAASSTRVSRTKLHDQIVIQSTPVSNEADSGIFASEKVEDDFSCDTARSGYSGCVNLKVMPTVTLDAKANPVIAPVAHHVAAAQARLKDAPGSKDAPFTLSSSATDNSAARNRHCEGNAGFHYDKPRNGACDDYPFAPAKQDSTTPFSVTAVPAAAETARDTLVTSFASTNHVFGGDKFVVGTTLTDAKSGTVAADAALTNQFNSSSNNAGCADWSGGDATNSILLPNGQRAWFFSDSFLGSPSARKNFFGFSSLHNSIVVQNGSSMRTITGGNTCQENNLGLDFWDRYAKTPAAAPDKGGFYWTGDQQLVDGNTVVKFYYHGVPSGDLWTNDYSAVARIPVSQFDNAVMTITPTPMRCSTDPKALWGTMTMKWKDGYYYIYGTGAVAPQRLYLARATAANLSSFGNWQFLSSVDTKAGTAGWSSSCAAAVDLPIGLATGGSVSYLNGAVWLIQDDFTSGAASGGQIQAFPSDTPWGFSSRHLNLYLPPEAHHDFPYFYQVYEPRVQAGLTSGGNLVLSYNVNSAAVDTGCTGATNWDAGTYRPRFFTVPSSWFQEDDAATVSSEGPVKAANPNVTTIGGATDWFDHWGHPCPAVAAATALVDTIGSNGAVNLTWHKSGNDVWSYLYQCDATTTACSTTSSCTSDTGGFTKQFGGLWLTDDHVVQQPITSAAVNGHTFVWYVCTSGASSGNGGPSAQVRGKVTLPVPASPTGLHGTRSGTSVSLAWNRVTFPSPSVYYTPYYWDVTAGGDAGHAVAGAPTTGTSLSLSVPDPTHVYGFLLRASNVAGVSGNSNVITL